MVVGWAKPEIAGDSWSSVGGGFMITSVLILTPHVSPVGESLFFSRFLKPIQEFTERSSRAATPGFSNGLSLLPSLLSRAKESGAPVLVLVEEGVLGSHTGWKGRMELVRPSEQVSLTPLI